MNYESDCAIQALTRKLAEHKSRETGRIAQLQTRISQGWEELRTLKRQRCELNRRINAKQFAVRAMVRRTRVRKPCALHRRISARKAVLRRREEKRMAREFTRQAIMEFRRAQGIPAVGVDSQVQ